MEASLIYLGIVAFFALLVSTLVGSAYVDDDVLFFYFLSPKRKTKSMNNPLTYGGATTNDGRSRKITILDSSLSPLLILLHG